MSYFSQRKKGVVQLPKKAAIAHRPVKGADKVKQPEINNILPEDMIKKLDEAFLAAVRNKNTKYTKKNYMEFIKNKIDAINELDDF